MLTLSSSPSQYSAQLKVWGLRTYKSKDTVLTNSERREWNVLLHGRPEATQSTRTRQAYPELDIVSGPGSGSGTQAHPRDQTLDPRLTPVHHRPIFESLEENGLNDDQKQAAMGARRLDSPLSNETSSHNRDVDDDVGSERSLPPSQGAQSPPSVGKANTHFSASKTVQDAVRRVVQVLSEVLADSELKDFFDNLTNTELEELLTNHVKLNEARNNALLKHTGELLRFGDFFGAHPTRLFEIVCGKPLNRHLWLTSRAA
jgi:hypothetical protein